ncbi:hypothetical protein ES703_95356 [subsurface metagenome]
MRLRIEDDGEVANTPWKVRRSAIVVDASPGNLTVPNVPRLK